MIGYRCWCGHRVITRAELVKHVKDKHAAELKRISWSGRSGEVKHDDGWTPVASMEIALRRCKKL